MWQYAVVGALCLFGWYGVYLAYKIQTEEQNSVGMYLMHLLASFLLSPLYIAWYYFVRDAPSAEQEEIYAGQ